MMSSILAWRVAAAGALGLSALVAASPPGQALEQLNRYVFVPSRASAEVAVIDSKTDEVVARVPVGRVPHQVAVSDVTWSMAVSNTADDTVSIIDLRSLGPVATVPLDHEPEHMEVSPTGDLLAVGNIGAGTISLVSFEERRELRRVEGLHEPHNMTFSPDGSLLYVGNLGADFVSVVDVASGEVVNEIPVGEPKAVAARGDGGTFQGIITVTRTPDGALGFAAYGEGDQMAVIDLRTQAKVKTLELGDLPWRAYGTADGRFVLVPNNGDETVSVISTSSLEEVARLPGAADMTGVNTGWFETTAFVISRGEDKAVVIDLVAMETVGEIALPSSPETGVVTPDGRKLYVALSGSDRVAVIDVRERKLIRTIDHVGEEPWGAHMVGAVNYCH
jgi:YVTN family beta-propeller protein